MSKLRIWSAAAVALVGVIGACGGKVVVDGGPGSGAAGGIGGGLTGGASNVGGFGGASCFNPPDPASLSFCSGGVTTGGSSIQCENDFCDAEGNTWTALCTETTCQCKLNTMVLCTCALNGPGNFCAGTATCCPLPKI